MSTVPAIPKDLQQLASAIQAIEQPWHNRTHPLKRPDHLCIPTGWSAIDCVLGGGLPLHTVHEWFASADAPPLFIMAHLARQVGRPSQGRGCLWIGRRCWPHGAALGDDLLSRSLFIDPRDDAMRLWAIDLALRSPAVAAVIADGTGFQMAHTRRLQLAAEVGVALALLVRPDREVKTLSAAGTRWLIEPCDFVSGSSGGRLPRWTARLLRCKGMQPASRPPKWALEVDDATHRIRASGEVVD